MFEALIKNKEHKEAGMLLASVQKRLQDFYKSEENNIYAKLLVLKVTLQGPDPSFSEAESLAKKALKIYEKVYHGTAKHRNQAIYHSLDKRRLEALM